MVLAPCMVGPPPRSEWGRVCACATLHGSRMVKTMLQKVTTLREAIAALILLYDSNDLCLHYSSEQGDLLEAAIEYLRTTTFTE